MVNKCVLKINKHYWPTINMPHNQKYVEFKLRFIAFAHDNLSLKWGMNTIYNRDDELISNSNRLNLDREEGKQK